jgi:hypothetical protein
MLLAGAGLLFRTLIQLQRTNPGFNPNTVLTFRFSLPSARYKAPVDRTALFANAIERIERLPGVRSASAVSFLPFGMAAGTGVRIAGRPVKPDELPIVTVRTVMPRYIFTMGIPLLRGRDFTAADNTTQSPPAVYCQRGVYQGRHAQRGAGRKIH